MEKENLVELVREMAFNGNDYESILKKLDQIKMVQPPIIQTIKYEG